MLQHFYVIAGMALADVLYTLWSRKSAQSNAFWAGIYAAGLIPIYGSVVIMYNHDARYLISATIGAFLGTFIAIKLDSRAKSS